MKSLLGSLLVLFASAACAQNPAAHVSGQAIYTLTQQFLAAAPHRYVGSPGHARAEEFIKAHFAPEIARGKFETDSFTASTPIGQVAMRNYIVRYPGKETA